MKEIEATKRDVHPIGSMILLAMGLAIMAGSLRYEFGSFETPGGGFMPFFAGLSMAFFASIPLGQSLRRGWSPLRTLWVGVHWQRTVIVTTGLILFAIFLRDLGFLLATLLLLGGLFRILERCSWRVTLVATLATAFGFYLVFQIWLQAQLPHGFLGF